jgi:ribosome-associated protein
MNKEIIAQEVQYRTSRSSGSGGQHVNKVETKVELVFNINTSKGISEEEKQTLNANLAQRINQDGVLRIIAQDTRSQLKNKEVVWRKFVKLLDHALTPKKVRKLKPVLADRNKRLTAKRLNSEKKAWRSKIDDF